MLVVSSVAAGMSADDLQPSDGVFEEHFLDYRLTLRRALLAEHDVRKCQILTVPAFEREWVVYLVRTDSNDGQVVFKVVKSHLWPEMPFHKPQRPTKPKPSEGIVGQNPPVETSIAALPAPTADLLEEVWSAMLARVRYPKRVTLGLDGTTYHVAHRQRGVGTRSGTTWSPDPGSYAGAVVSIAQRLRDYARADDDKRAGLAVQITSEATHLLERLKRAE
jgi:hypothetical protein